MQLPLISIALCTYNGEKYLKEQLDSLLAQTYQNLEIIIVDDGSTDNTYRMITDFAEKDKRIQYSQNASNLGYNKNFEKTISLTKGDFIAICDQDDIWEPDKIQVLLDNIGNNWLVISNSVLIDENGKLLDKELLKSFNFFTGLDFRGILLDNFVTGHTCLMSREFLSHLFPFPALGYYDWWMGFIAIYHKKINYVGKVLTKYRLHENSVTQGNERLRKNFENTINMLNNFLSYKGLNDNDRSYIENLLSLYSKKAIVSHYLPLIMFVNKNYDTIFPTIKKRKGVSKFNFAIRFSRKVTPSL
jgi:glycosyltransferase involved in cell wall biosynthesis